MGLSRNLVLWKLFPKLRLSCQRCRFGNPSQAAVVVTIPNQSPALVRLALDVGLARLPLGVEGIEILLKPKPQRKRFATPSSLYPSSPGLRLADGWRGRTMSGEASPDFGWATYRNANERRSGLSRSRCDVSDTPPAKLCQKSSICGRSVGQGLQNCGRSVVGSDVGKSRASRCDCHSLIPAEMRSQQPRQI